jgi:adenosylhomocysteine nucleosidase
LIVFALPFEAAGFSAGTCRMPVWVLGRAGRTGAGLFRERLRNRPVPPVVVAAGLAGALDPALRVGDLCAEVHGPAGWSPLPRGLWKPVRIAHAEHIVATAEEKQSLRDSGDICDMESALLATTCLEAGIPFLSLRAVSDTAHADLPVPPETLLDPTTGLPRTPALLAHLATHPQKIFHFAHMVRHARTARHRLHAALHQTPLIVNQAASQL